MFKVSSDSVSFRALKTLLGKAVIYVSREQEENSCVGINFLL